MESSFRATNLSAVKGHPFGNDLPPSFSEVQPPENSALEKDFFMCARTCPRPSLSMVIRYMLKIIENGG
jgi:hypothetical protein